MNFAKYAIPFLVTILPIHQSSTFADLIAGSTTVHSVADQTVTVTNPSLLPPIPGGAMFDLSAFGSFTIGWDAEAGGIANLSSFSANFSEVHPALGPYQLQATGIGPTTGFAGELSNIVDAGGSLVSADLELFTTFSLLAPGLPTLYTKDQVRFTGVLDGNGSIGNVFISDGPVDIFASLGDISTDPLFAVSSNRTVTGVAAVPEPSTFMLFGGIGVLALVRRGIRSRRNTQTAA